MCSVLLGVIMTILSAVIVDVPTEASSYFFVIFSPSFVLCRHNLFVVFSPLHRPCPNCFFVVFSIVLCACLQKFSIVLTIYFSVYQQSLLVFFLIPLLPCRDSLLVIFSPFWHTSSSNTYIHTIYGSLKLSLPSSKFLEVETRIILNELNIRISNLNDSLLVQTLSGHLCFPIRIDNGWIVLPTYTKSGRDLDRTV